LKGKVQKLKDKQFGKVALFTPHKNPTAKAETNIKHYKHHSIARAYRGETFYWGLVPQSGDFILFQLTPPVEVTLAKVYCIWARVVPSFWVLKPGLTKQ